MPDDTPLTIPVAEPIVATPEVEELHVPPPVASVSVVVEPVQTEAVPEIDEGSASTVTVFEAVQPVDNAYTIKAVPAETPVTTPVAEPIVAMPVPVDVHVPPPASDKVVVAPIHKVAVPEIDAGNGLTVTILKALQPEGNV